MVCLHTKCGDTYSLKAPSPPVQMNQMPKFKEEHICKFMAKPTSPDGPQPRQHALSFDREQEQGEALGRGVFRLTQNAWAQRRPPSRQPVVQLARPNGDVVGTTGELVCACPWQY